MAEKTQGTKWLRYPECRFGWTFATAQSKANATGKKPARKMRLFNSIKRLFVQSEQS
jgi:hypothetical protein